MKNVLVTGATGRIGGIVASELERRGWSVRAAVRRPRPTGPSPTGLAADVEFDFEKPATFPAALEGTDSVFLIARPGDDTADRVAAPLIKEMRRRGIRHVVNLTAMGVETLPDTALRKIERAIEDCGLAFTHLRPNFFMQIFAAEPLLSTLRTAGEIAVPAGDAKLSFVDARDVAAVAVASLTGLEHRGQAYTLTGEHAIDHGEVARSITRAAGSLIRYRALDEEAARRAVIASGLSDARADRLVGFYRLVRAGRCAATSDDVRRVLGRAPISFDQFADDYANVWSETRIREAPLQS